jgi:predicted permease
MTGEGDLRSSDAYMNWLTYLRHAVRSLIKNPSFAVFTILTLALGIGVTSAIFSVVYGVLLKPTPYRRPGQICLIWKSVPKKNLERDWTSYPTYMDWKRDATSFEDIAAFLRPDGSIVNLSENDNVEQVQSSKVSSNFFSVLGTPAMLGRTFQPADTGNGTRLAVLSDKFWRDRFRSNPGVIGTTLRIDDASFQVIGVMPPGFAFPAKESQSWSRARETQLWVPIESDPRWPKFQQFRIADAFGVVGRLKAGAASDQAQAEMTAIASKLGRQYPATDLDLGIRVVPLALYLVSPRLRLALVLFFAAVLLVLLIACANVAGLFFSRTHSRRKALAIQSALGARRAHILGRVFAEATVAAMGAAVIGVGLAALGVKVLLIMAPSDLPGLEQVAVNRYVLLFAVSVSLLSGWGSALVPAVKLSSANLQTELRGVVVSSRDSHRLQEILVFFECALAVVLLTATGLLLRSAIRLDHQGIGFRTDHLLSVNLFLHGPKYDDDAQIRAFVDDAIRRVNSLPGVRSSAIVAVFLGRLPNSRLQVEGREGSNSVLDDVPATWTYVSEEFFKTISIPILRGRSFTSSDGPDLPPVAIVNQSMARRLWPGENPVGRRFKYDVPGYEAKEWLIVVGVAGDTARDGPETQPAPVIYYPVRQKVWDALVLMVRTDSDPAALGTVVANQIHQIDETIPRVEPTTVEEQLWEMGSQRRFQTGLFALFGLLAMALAAIGIYAVVSYSVGQRTLEIGIRMALGAQRDNVLAMILCQCLTPAVLGLIVGAMISFACSRVLTGFLFGISTSDPTTYLNVCGLLLAIAALASYVPAHRAIKADPLVSLRFE